MTVLTLDWVMICITGDHEDVVLHCGQVGVPPPQQGDQHKHQPLGVEGWPAEEERDHHGNWKQGMSSYLRVRTEPTQHLYDLSSSKSLSPEGCKKNIKNGVCSHIFDNYNYTQMSKKASLFFKLVIIICCSRKKYIYVRSRKLNVN